MIRCEEAVAIRAKLAQECNLNLDNEAIEDYPERHSVLRIIKLPINFMNPDLADSEQIKKLLFDDYFEYMGQYGYCLAGDAVGVKVGLSRENGKDMQYIILGMPVAEIKE